MIPIAFMTAAMAKALGAKPGWPTNPPRLGIYITSCDGGRLFFWPADKRLVTEMRR